MPRDGPWRPPVAFSDVLAVSSLAVVSAYLGWRAVRPVVSGDALLLDQLALGGIVAAFAVWWVYDELKPRHDTACEHCGEPVYVHSNRRGTSEAFVVEAAGTPRRQRLGPLSIIRERKTSKDVYCSGECAAEDERFFVHPYSPEAADEEVTDRAA